MARPLVCLRDRTEPTDEELFRVLIYGLCLNLSNPKEENETCVSGEIPNSKIRYLAKLLVKKLELDIPVDIWIKWCQLSNRGQFHVDPKSLIA